MVQKMQAFPSMLQLKDMVQVGKSKQGNWLQTVKLNWYVYCIATSCVVQH
jgi:hypothetical protein